MAFVEVKNLSAVMAMGAGQAAYTTTGDKLYYVGTSGGDKLYEYNPLTNTETMVVQQSDLTAIETNSSAPFDFPESGSIVPPVGFSGGAVYFTSADTVLRRFYIWQYLSSTGAVTKVFQDDVPGPELFDGFEVQFFMTDVGAVLKWYFSSTESFNGTNDTYFKSAIGSPFRKAPKIPGFEKGFRITGPGGGNVDTTGPVPYFAAGVSLLVRWSGSSWLIIDTSYAGPSPPFRYGASHYWTAFPASSIPGGGRSKGVWTDDFATTTAVVGSIDVFGAKDLNMPFETGIPSLGNQARYKASTNEWVAWCTGTFHQPGVSDDRSLMWKDDLGDIYRIYAPFTDDWRVAKLTDGT